MTGKQDKSAERDRQPDAGLSQMPVTPASSNTPAAVSSTQANDAESPATSMHGNGLPDHHDDQALDGPVGPSAEDTAQTGPDQASARLPLPLRERLASAIPGVAVALAPIAALLLVGGGTAMRLGAVCLAFLGGALAVHLITRDDARRKDVEIAELDADRRALRERLEQSEDQAWELREAGERQASILQALGDVVIRRDMNGTVLYVSPAAREMFHPDAMPRIGQSLRLPIADARDNTGTAAGDVAFGDIMLATRQGPRWFSRLDVTVRDGTRDTPLVQTLLRDVTERRMMEEELLAARNSAETASEAKSRFLATVSHEIRTPLNGILGMAALLRDTRLTPEQIAYADALTTSGETLLLLIDELLDFSRAEAGRLTLHPAPVALEPLCEQVVELLAPRAQAKGLEIALTLSPDVPASVTVDASRLRQILFNLAGNGVKFTEAGGVTVDILIEAGIQSAGDLIISVSDTGIGFAPEDAARMFGEFEQVDHGPARRYGGTGLGLAIVQRLVALMHGTISADGALGGGARFVIRLPIPEAPAVPAPWPAVANRRIAVVSAGRVEADALSRHLVAHGGKVQQLLPGDPDLTEALGRAELVFLDNGSVSDGAAWLAGARAAGFTAPAVVLITPAERERLDRLRVAGFAAYLVRPVRSQSLMRTVNMVLTPDGAVGSESADLQMNEPWGRTDTSTPAAGGIQMASGKVQDAVEPVRLAPSRPLRLLLAEDNDINRLLGEALLRKLGHEAELVTNGTEAVTAARQGCFDAILMDLHMPGLDGFSAITAIRMEEAARGANPVPILIVTADVMPAARERAEELGVIGYVTKPLSQAAVADALRQISLRG